MYEEQTYIQGNKTDMQEETNYIQEGTTDIQETKTDIQDETNYTHLLAQTDGFGKSEFKADTDRSFLDALKRNRFCRNLHAADSKSNGPPHIIQPINGSGCLQTPNF